MLSKLSKMFRRIQSTFEPEQIEDIDDGLNLCPPADPLDVAGWDQFWLRHIEYGIGPSIMDMFCDDSTMIETWAAARREH